MNSREKFLSVMRMDPGRHSVEVQVPKVEFGYWAGVLRRWFREGLEERQPVPAEIPDGEAVMANRNVSASGLEKAGDLNVQPVFGLDQYLTKFPVDYSPGFPRQVLEQTPEYVVYRDSFGVTNRNDPGMRSLPMELDNPVKDRASWERYKEHYEEGTIAARLPADWDLIAARLRERDFPIRLGGTYGGFLGFPRQIMGLTRYLLTLYDDPALIHDICDTFLRFLRTYYERIIRDVRVDCILIWEDMAGKQGSLISPAHFREFLAPRYRELVGFAREAGVGGAHRQRQVRGGAHPLIVQTRVTDVPVRAGRRRRPAAHPRGLPGLSAPGRLRQAGAVRGRLPGGHRRGAGAHAAAARAGPLHPARGPLRFPGLHLGEFRLLPQGPESDHRRAVRRNCMKKRYAFLMRIKPELKAEYQKVHDQIWPDMARAIRRSGIRNYRSISRRRNVVRLPRSRGPGQGLSPGWARRR
jgi:hypothetical protein